MRLATNWRTDWQRGPSLPSMFNGKPTTSAAISCRRASSASLARSAASLLRFSVSKGVASMRKASDVARPMVLLPTSRAIRRPAGTAALSSSKSTIGMSTRFGLEPGGGITCDALPAGLADDPMALSGIFDIVGRLAEVAGRAAHHRGRREPIALGGDDQQRYRDQPRVDVRGLAPVEERQAHLEQ